MSFVCLIFSFYQFFGLCLSPFDIVPDVIAVFSLGDFLLLTIPCNFLFFLKYNSLPDIPSLGFGGSPSQSFFKSYRWSLLVGYVSNGL